MKLKKIASLALAGIMAVSMLAGCKNDGSSSSSSETVTVPAANIASVLNDARDDFAKNGMEVTYTESASLKALLTDLAADEYNTAAKVETAGGKMGYGAAGVIGHANGMYNKIADTLTAGGKTLLNGWDNGAVTTTATAGTTSNYIVLYTDGGNNSVETMGNAISDLSGVGLNAITNGFSTELSGSSISYSADVAAVKVVNPDNADASVWVVAVVFTQTVA